MSSQEQNKKQFTLTKWVNDHSNELYSWALHKTSSKDVAEDIVQDTFLAAVKSYEKFKGESTPKTWLFSIANRLIIDYYRKKTKLNLSSLETEIVNMSFENGGWKHPNQGDFTTDMALLDNHEFLKVYNDCLSKLPLKWQGIMHSKYIEQKNNKVICQDFEITVSNLWQIVHRVKLQLKLCLDKNWINE